MPLWGIVLIGVAVWLLVSVVLGVLIGRAVKVADAHRRDQVLTQQLVRRPAAAGAPADLPPGYGRDDRTEQPAPRTAAR
jgi:hypothetical protein